VKVKYIISGCALVIASVLTASFASTAYQRDSQFESFDRDLDVLTNTIENKLSEAPTLARVREAQAVLDAMKPVLSRELTELKTLDPARFSGPALLRFYDSMALKSRRITLLLDNPELRRAAREDPALREAVLKLHADYFSIIRGEQESPSGAPPSRAADKH
jgi:hypothetical protein